MTALAMIVLFVGGWFAHAGYVYRRARLDTEVLVFLLDRTNRTRPCWYYEIEQAGVGGIFLPVRFRRLMRDGFISAFDLDCGYCITDLGCDRLRVECQK